MLWGRREGREVGRLVLSDRCWVAQNWDVIPQESHKHAHWCAGMALAISVRNYGEKISDDFEILQPSKIRVTPKIIFFCLKSGLFYQFTRDRPGVALVIIFLGHFSQFTEKSNFLLELPFHQF